MYMYKDCAYFYGVAKNFKSININKSTVFRIEVISFVRQFLCYVNISNY